MSAVDSLLGKMAGLPLSQGFIPNNEAVQWCNEAIKNEIINVSKYIHGLELALFALLIGIALSETYHYLTQKHLKKRIKELEYNITLLTGGFKEGGII